MASRLLIFVLASGLWATGLQAQESVDYARAERTFEHADRVLESMNALATEHPSAPWAHHFRARALEEIGFRREARQAIRRAIELNEKESLHHVLAARLSEARGAYEDAGDAYDRAARIDERPEAKKAYRDLAASPRRVIESTEAFQSRLSTALISVIASLLGLLLFLFLRERRFS